MRCASIEKEIQHKGYQYRMMKLGRGISHEEAFKAGALLVLNMIKKG